MTATRVRRRLEIRCTGRAVNPRTNKHVGRVCGTVFVSARPYRSRADWIQRARAVGWRVSPLRPDNTVNACCPRCSSGGKKNRQEP